MSFPFNRNLKLHSNIFTDSIYPKNTVLKKKNDNSRFNNYSTNKEEILIDNLFESRLNYLQQNHYDDKKINYI